MMSQDALAYTSPNPPRPLSHLKNCRCSFSGRGDGELISSWMIRNKNQHIMDCKGKSDNIKYLDIAEKNLVAVEDLLMAVEISGTDEIVIVQGEAVVDLAEYDLTPQELAKFRQIFQRLNAKLAESFQKQFPASSVVSEIRSKSHSQHG